MPGMKFGEHLPKLARHGNDLAVVSTGDGLVGVMTSEDGGATWSSATPAPANNVPTPSSAVARTRVARLD